MGGKSHSNFTIGSQTCTWQGTVEIVPSLSAPGFCNLETPGYNRFNDASTYSHLVMKLKSDIDYYGWKVSFAADTLNPQFKSFKSDFNITGDGKWHEIAIPWDSFTNDWSDYTGMPRVIRVIRVTRVTNG